jgi:hypothetical protein
MKHMYFPYYWNGSMDDFRIYNWALQEADIHAIFVIDSDGDGLTDRDEVVVHGTDPNNADTDGDPHQFRHPPRPRTGPHRRRGQSQRNLRQSVRSPLSPGTFG